MKEKMVWALGLMSGTSLDGIDAALIKTNGKSIESVGHWLTLPYEDEMKIRLRDAVRELGDIPALEKDLTELHAVAVRELLKKAGMPASDVEVIGFHGQTIAHRPHQGITTQIGDGALLAKLTGINVINDFRRPDVAAGGQGAPLVPLFHAALAKDQPLPVAVLNIGGVANVTWVGKDGQLLAFDTGPGNALINDWVHQKVGADCDMDGIWAKQGQVAQYVVFAMLRDAFFDKMPPKSLDRNHFKLAPITYMSLEDGAATLTEFTAAAVMEASGYFPEPVNEWLVCGGGRHNPAIMNALSHKLEDVRPVEAVGWLGDALEAQAFGFLAVRSLYGLPISLPSTTGARHPVTGGTLHKV